MGAKFTKHINQDFFKKWTSEMAYVLGYIIADGCITVSRERKKHPFSLNVTSAEKKNLLRIKRALESEHKIGIKYGGRTNIPAYQLQIRNPILTKDLMDIGVLPRKTYNLKPIKVPREHFRDFFRGFFDGDGSVYIYKVNGTPQIKASFCNPRFHFVSDLNQRLCKSLGISLKTIHKDMGARRKIPLYYIDFYIDDCERLYHFIYGNNPSFYLPRKRKVFEKWKSIKRRHYIKRNYHSKVGWHSNLKIRT